MLSRQKTTLKLNVRYRPLHRILGTMYLRTDEEHHAADAMHVAAYLALGVATDLHLWPWIIIAVHNAVQGVMVLSLRHGNGLLALREGSSDSCTAAEKLDDFLN